MPKANVDSKSKPVDSRLKLKSAATWKRQSKKAAKDPNKPKRPPSSFFVFMSDFREQFKKENPYNKSVTAVGKAAGEKWKSMTNADKAPYIAKAEKKKEEYKKTLHAYHDTLSGQSYSSSSATGSASSFVAAPASSYAVAPASAALPNLCRAKQNMKNTSCRSHFAMPPTSSATGPATSFFAAPASSYAVAPASAALPNLRGVAPASVALPNLRHVAPASPALPNLRRAEQVHDNASQFQKKGCEHHKQLGMLFNKNRATRVLHHSSIQDPLDIDEENELERQYINTESGSHAHPDNDSSDYIQEVEGITPSRKRKIQAKAHTSKRESTPHQMREALAPWAEASMAKVEGYRRVDDSYSLAKCVTTLGEIQGISEDTYMKALYKFKDPDWREMFIVMPNDKKLGWLNRL